ncbi:MAG: cyclic nucleotide-binding domain-containing protein [Chloroflexi bacterium]|nr:cyclic nucleotide-binding domain-containing protein [Chloroflexota bacterium]
MAVERDMEPGERSQPRALFAWFPAHNVQHDEDQLRAETLLAGIPLFKRVPPHRLRAIAELTQTRSFKAGQVVFGMGEVGSRLYVIRSGEMQVVRGEPAGAPVVLARLGPGEFFGELSLFDRGTRSATVIATTDTETLTLGRADILELLQRFPEIGMSFLEALSDRLRTADNLLENADRIARLNQAPEQQPG